MEEYMNSLEQQLNIKYFYLKSYLFSHLSIRIMLMCFLHTLPPLALQLPEHCVHAYDVTSVTYSR
ncbi:hypothetical protein BvCmsKSNP041_01288 [Escherichia coli]|nr:hypothetical protein BvCmsB22A_02834 [Escherichia coli]GDI96622.1 hypothetical protein BvCmsKSNP035_00542 [Escherichia coli]GDJ13686.1 hypothetical protein BvCmsKSNP041_01288 [Escherichia coli]GDK79211.1 hypothetical protein BvCmsKSNP069_00492 [Escherichia coli]GDT83258.1 hypothetical protein BvCmsSINP041_04137 [Escherichia coli]